MRRRVRAGFTLVELMVVLAVMAIAAGFAAPSLLESVPGMRASSAARQVLSDLRFARTLAVEKGVDTYLEFDAPATGHYRVFLDRDGSGGYSAGDEKVREVDLAAAHAGIVLASNDAGAPGDGVDLDGAGADTVGFRPRGSATGSGAVYLMPSRDAGGRNDRNRRVRLVGSTGNVRIETFDGSAWQ